MPVVRGPFAVEMRGEPPYEAADGVTLARVAFDKRFSGTLDAVSQVNMLAARTPVAGSAGYVALERIVGQLAGRAGSFVVLHTGIMDRGASSLTIRIVPDSGSGALAGIVGTMQIEMVDEQHWYTLDYQL